MGYQVSAIANLGGDFHEVFVIFVPGTRLQHEWINEWIYEKFGTLAKRLGPEVVIVTPPEGGNFRDFRREKIATPELYADIMHSGFPFLVVTGRPLTEDEDAVVVNLAAFGSEQLLAKFFDSLIETSKATLRVKDIAALVPDTDLSPSYHGGWQFAFEEALEIKPNFFGVGINVNALAAWWRARREARAAVTDVE